MRLLLCIAVVLATAAGVAAAAARHQPPPHTGPIELLAKAGKTVTATGVPVSGLFPGASSIPLVFTVKNANAYTVKVTPLKAAVALKTSVANCPGTFVTATLATKTLTIAKQRTKTLKVMLAMSNLVTDPCQGARFTVSVTYKAVKK
jgi:hypothetical protein